MKTVLTEEQIDLLARPLTMWIVMDNERQPVLSRLNFDPFARAVEAATLEAISKPEDVVLEWEDRGETSRAKHGPWVLHVGIQDEPGPHHIYIGLSVQEEWFLMPLALGKTLPQRQAEAALLFNRLLRGEPIHEE